MKVYKQFISIILSISLVGASVSSSCAREQFFIAVPGEGELKFSLLEPVLKDKSGTAPFSTNKNKPRIRCLAYIPVLLDSCLPIARKVLGYFILRHFKENRTVFGSRSSNNLFEKLASQWDIVPSLREPKDYNGKIIIVGGSAFGYSALKEIIKRLPDEHPPIIVCEHLLPNEKFMNFVIKSKRNIVLCGNGTHYESGNFYLERNVIIIGAGMMKPVVSIRRDSKGYPYIPVNNARSIYGPIDTLFVSAAKHFKGNVVGVVISGVGGDCVIGAKQINSTILIQKDFTKREAFGIGMISMIKMSGVPYRSVTKRKMALAIMSAV